MTSNFSGSDFYKSVNSKTTKLFQEAIKYMELRKIQGKNWMREADKVYHKLY